jgi:hypothetical protein
MPQMSRFREALEDACKAVEIVLLRKYYDPAGQAQDEPRLRGMGKWRFILFRGIVGFSVLMFLFLALSDLSENIQTTHAFHHWLAGFCMSARQLVSWLACLHGGELCRTCGRVPSPTLSPVPSP